MSINISICPSIFSEVMGLRGIFSRIMGLRGIFPRIMGLRGLLNSTAMDIMYYTSPLYRYSTLVQIIEQNIAYDYNSHGYIMSTQVHYSGTARKFKLFCKTSTAIDLYCTQANLIVLD